MSDWITSLGGDTALARELALRGREMGSTEWSVKHRRFIQSGGYWPTSLAFQCSVNGMEFQTCLEDFRKSQAV